MAADVRELCVTDHWNLLDQQGNRLPTVYDWSAPLEQYRAVRSRLPEELEVRLGIEVGNGVLDPAAVDASLTIPELDFVIGSLHSQSAAAGGRGIFTVAKECRRKEDGAEHEHTFPETYEYDKDGHWKQANCGHNVTTDREAHTYVNGE